MEGEGGTSALLPWLRLREAGQGCPSPSTIRTLRVLSASVAASASYTIRTLRVLSASVAASASYTIRTLRVLSASAAASYTVLPLSHASRAQGSAAPQRFSVTQKHTSQVPLLVYIRSVTHRHTSQVPLLYKERDTQTHVTGASSL